MSRFVFSSVLLGVAMSVGCAVGVDVDDAEHASADGRAVSNTMAASWSYGEVVPNRRISRDCDHAAFGGVKGKWYRKYLTGWARPKALGLRGVCAYEWYSPWNAPPELGALQNLPTVPDAYAFAPLASTAESLAYQADIGLHKQLLGQLDALGNLPLADGAMSDVRVYLVDTAPDSDGDVLRAGVSGHGYSLARLIENITCPSGDHSQDLKNCVKQPRTVLGMEYGEPGKKGGYFGSYWSVASAVARAAESFYAQLEAGKADHLLVNLSAGWEPKRGGAYSSVSGEELSPDHFAMQRAIAYVNCLGGAVIASAGNKLYGPSTAGGLTYPAAWYKNVGWTAGRCKDFMGELPSIAPATSYHPFVYAVGGVGGDDLDIYNTRANSTPRLVAPSHHALGLVAKGTKYYDEDGQSHIASETLPTRRMTGTSVSAAVATAGAALLWSYRGDLQASEVMDYLYSGGVNLNTVSHPRLATAGPADAVHRISICGGLMAACATSKDRCPTVPPTCSTTKAYAGKVSSVPVTLSEAMEDVHSIGSVFLFSHPAAPSSVLDAFSNWQEFPSLAPQPWALPTCGSCAINFDRLTRTNSISFQLGIDTQTSLPTAKRYEQPALVYTDAFGGSHTYDLSGSIVGPISLNESYIIRRIPMATVPRSAALALKIVDERTVVTVPIAVGR